MENSWKEIIYRQREELARLLHQPLAQLAKHCAAAWGDRDRLNAVLLGGFADIPHCTFLYVLDTQGVQVCDNIARDGVLPGHFGRDRSQRPYMREAVPVWGFLLSDAYISLLAHRPSLTALHVIRRDDKPLGYLGADFDLRNLPVTAAHYEEPGHWRQIKGDPSIRSTVFLQKRAESPLDRNMDQALSILAELLTERGMFQGVIHFSSSRVTAWFLDDPYRYRLLDQEVLADPDICLAYAVCPYPDDALIPKESIGPILDGMRELRLADDVIYLRSASINIFNGMISLTFSCDGSHYMRHDEFLEKNMAFWLGSAA
jgi:hypothetical protein